MRYNVGGLSWSIKSVVKALPCNDEQVSCGLEAESNPASPKKETVLVKEVQRFKAQLYCAHKL